MARHSFLSQPSCLLPSQLPKSSFIRSRFTPPILPVRVAFERPQSVHHLFYPLPDLAFHSTQQGHHLAFLSLQVHKRVNHPGICLEVDRREDGMQPLDVRDEVVDVYEQRVKWFGEGGLSEKQSMNQRAQVESVSNGQGLGIMSRLLVARRPSPLIRRIPLMHKHILILILAIRPIPGCGMLCRRHCPEATTVSSIAPHVVACQPRAERFPHALNNFRLEVGFRLSQEKDGSTGCRPRAPHRRRPRRPPLPKQNS
ncbi:hypothetical protein TPAR_03719, partial [Tolypocladium paradoxum]